jgi:hypothetical protein
VGLGRRQNSFSTGWTDGIEREGVGSSNDAKFAIREQLSVQTPSPDVPTLEPTRRRFIRRDISILVELFLIIDPSNVTHKPTQAHSWINPE